MSNYAPPADLAANAHINKEKYEEMYKQSITDPDTFWAEQAKTLDWFKEPTQIKTTSFDEDTFGIEWFKDGELNVSYNCIDRHLETRGEQNAIIWEGDNPKESKT